MSGRISCMLRMHHDQEVAIGPGKADLLDAIRATVSISAAARTMDMSYRHAWMLVDVMNRCFSEPLVQGAAGGQHGGGAHITAAGERVLGLFRQAQAAALAAAQAPLDALALELNAGVVPAHAPKQLAFKVAV